MRSNRAIFALFTLALLSWGLYQALVGAPTEATMGPVQRIFYYHVPNAWVMELCFPLNFLASIIYLATRKPAVDAFAVATAEVGVVFLHGRAADRADLGAASLGNLVDLGRAPHKHAGALADLRRLPDAA